MATKTRARDTIGGITVLAEAALYIPLLTDLCGKVDPVKFITNSDDYPAIQKRPMAEWIAGWCRGVADAHGIGERELWVALDAGLKKFAGEGKEPDSKPNTSPTKRSKIAKTKKGA